MSFELLFLTMIYSLIKGKGINLASRGELLIINYFPFQNENFASS